MTGSSMPSTAETNTLAYGPLIWPLSNSRSITAMGYDRLPYVMFVGVLAAIVFVLLAMAHC
jgi:hypothetical protein